MAREWNFVYEKKVNEIIMAQNLKNYNIANLVYDTPSAVQKYLLRIHNAVDGLSQDYWSNRYLFILSSARYDFMRDPAYEVHTFTPSDRIRTWRINNRYSLYLLRRRE